MVEGAVEGSHGRLSVAVGVDCKGWEVTPSLATTSFDCTI